MGSLRRWMIVGAAAVVLAGCSDDESATESEAPVVEVPESGSDEPSVLLDEEGNAQPAEDVPAEEEEALKAAFTRYIDTFNNEDVEGYMATLSSDPSSFSLDGEQEQVEQVFEAYDVTREVSDVMIIEYNEDTANVFATVNAVTADPDSGAEATGSGRQITVFEKEDGEWKIDSIYYMGNQ